MRQTLLGLIIATLLLPLFPALSFAQEGGATNRTAQEVGAARDIYETQGDVNSVILSSDLTSNNMFNISCQLGMVDACTADPNKITSYYQKSVIGKTNNLIANLYIQQPASVNQYIAYLKEQTGIVRPVYAQGVGFTGLSPFIRLWSAFRNIAYGFLIAVMGAIGFMILFRMKIDPRTVITIQSALPRIVMTLILITFSYAIVGFLIDAMYIVMFLTLAAISVGIGGFSNFGSVLQYYTGGSTLDLFQAVFAPSGAFSGTMWVFGGKGAVGDITSMLGGVQGVGGIGAIIGGIWGGVSSNSSPLSLSYFWGGIKGAAGGAASANALLHLLVSLAFLFAFIRILFTLLNAYISILLSVIFGPLQLMLGAFPNNDAFGSWFRNLVANIAVFPVVGTLLLLGTIISNDAGSNPQLWRPPGLAGTFVGSGVASGIGGIIGMAMVFIIPNIAGALKELLKAKSPLPIGAGAAVSPLTSVYGTAMGGASQLYYLKTLGLKLPWDKKTP